MSTGCDIKEYQCQGTRPKRTDVTLSRSIVLCLSAFWCTCLSYSVITIVLSRQLLHVKSKVKCTPVQALRLCTGCKTHRGSRGIALPFHDHGTRRGWGVSVTPQPLFSPGKDPVPIVQEAEWAPGPVWTDEENLASTGIRSPDRPARSQSLYRLSYPAQMLHASPIKVHDTNSILCACQRQFKPLHSATNICSVSRTNTLTWQLHNFQTLWNEITKFPSMWRDTFYLDPAA
jgi:hypothetical protein